MTDNDRQNFDKILIALAEIYDQKLSEERLDLYFAALKDMSLETFKEAANITAQTSRFFPKPVDFRESVSMSIEDKAAVALNQLEDAVKRYGYDKSVVFEDKTIHMVVQALDGWQAVCFTPQDEWKWKRKEFISLYKVFSANPRTEYPEKLIGYHDHNNEMKGHLEYIQKPNLIGDEHKAKPLTEKPLLESRVI